VPGIAGMIFAVPHTLLVRIIFLYSGELPRITGLWSAQDPWGMSGQDRTGY
jgi:hypothetical protein